MMQSLQPLLLANMLTGMGGQEAGSMSSNNPYMGLGLQQALVAQPAFAALMQPQVPHMRPLEPC